MNSTNFSGNTVDVKNFFAVITQGYSELTSLIHHFSQNLPDYSPHQISNECIKIQNKRDKLSLLDEQLYDIVDLTGAEIKNEPFVDDYRTAFNVAIAACNDLHANLVITKAELLSPQSSTSPN